MVAVTPTMAATATATATRAMTTAAGRRSAAAATEVALSKMWLAMANTNANANARQCRHHCHSSAASLSTKWRRSSLSLSLSLSLSPSPSSSSLSLSMSLPSSPWLAKSMTASVCSHSHSHSHSSHPRRQIHHSRAAWKGDGAPSEADADTDADPTRTARDKLTPYEEELTQAEARDPSLGPVPSWQNPRHHANPSKVRIFHDEFDVNGGESIPHPAPLPPLDDGSGKVLASEELHSIANDILAMNVLEVKELIDRISDHFGLDASLPSFAFGGSGGGASSGDAVGANDKKGEAAEQDKTAFDLKLTGFDSKAKIKVIKEVRAAAGLGLKEAKELVEGVPKLVRKAMKKEEAEELKSKLEAVGATVEIV